jgi:hypothetical protein
MVVRASLESRNDKTRRKRCVDNNQYLLGGRIGGLQVQC